ncbi:hypothetical protein V5E43_000661 [Yersinia enterocolitica]|uniref:hypothetical protein n=1 Tax=Yersinia TaxID=629 RepID=UPI0005E91E88|nr:MULTISPECIES: hypothetical protein [Yersinia]MCW6576460.1 hypothetical protein [Yersinia ruckeri]CQH79417.1 Uncharacterised protein [Yersinia enterocolitica]
MAELTAAEKKWVKQVNALLAKCPSKRLGFYTGGDPNVGIYNNTHQEEINADGGDLVNILQRNGWGFDEYLNFPAPVEAVCI